ncbi:MAG: FkbM family methyltransferase [Candidatus Rokubacteria bacterium]|nr:FkbM family methyltransferase [Candidatus Rokubacteria bacterium]
MRRRLFDMIAWYLKRTSPHPGRGVLARFAWWLDPHEIIHEMAPGVRIKVWLDRDDGVAYWTNSYEQHDEVRVFVSLLRPGMVVVDVGANIGMYTLLSARAVGPSGSVFAFEPVPEVYRRLTENLAINEIANVVPSRIALSDRTGTARFYLGRNHSMGSLYRAQTSAVIEVPLDTLDGFLERRGVAKVDAVKLDAEGAEMHIVRGMHRLLGHPDRPILFVEHNFGALRAAGSSAEELFTAILRYGYTPHLVEKGRLRPVPALVKPFRTSDEPYSNYIFLPREPAA